MFIEQRRIFRCLFAAIGPVVEGHIKRIGIAIRVKDPTLDGKLLVRADLIAAGVNHEFFQVDTAFDHVDGRQVGVVVHRAVIILDDIDVAPFFQRFIVIKTRVGVAIALHQRIELFGVQLVVVIDVRFLDDVFIARLTGRLEFIHQAGGHVKFIRLPSVRFAQGDPVGVAAVAVGEDADCLQNCVRVVKGASPQLQHYARRAVLTDTVVVLIAEGVVKLLLNSHGHGQHDQRPLFKLARFIDRFAVWRNDAVHIPAEGIGHTRFGIGFQRVDRVPAVAHHFKLRGLLGGEIIQRDHVVVELGHKVDGLFTGPDLEVDLIGTVVLQLEIGPHVPLDRAEFLVIPCKLTPLRRGIPVFGHHVALRLMLDLGVGHLREIHTDEIGLGGQVGQGGDSVHEVHIVPAVMADDGFLDIPERRVKGRFVVRFKAAAGARFVRQTLHLGHGALGADGDAVELFILPDDGLRLFQRGGVVEAAGVVVALSEHAVALIILIVAVGVSAGGKQIRLDRGVAVVRSGRTAHTEGGVAVRHEDNEGFSLRVHRQPVGNLQRLLPVGTAVRRDAAEQILELGGAGGEVVIRIVLPQLAVHPDRVVGGEGFRLSGGGEGDQRHADLREAVLVLVRVGKQFIRKLANRIEGCGDALVGGGDAACLAAVHIILHTAGPVEDHDHVRQFFMQHGGLMPVYAQGDGTRAVVVVVRSLFHLGLVGVFGRFIGLGRTAMGDVVKLLIADVDIGIPVGTAAVGHGSVVIAAVPIAPTAVGITDDRKRLDVIAAADGGMIVVIRRGAGRVRIIIISLTVLIAFHVVNQVGKFG